MRRRSIPIGYIGVMIIALAFIIWYGWSTQIAPLMEETHQHEAQNSTPPSTPAPSEAEVKAMLERNKQAISNKPPTTPQASAPKAPAKVEPPKPDPSRDVMDYWWEMKPAETGKK